MTNPGVGIVTVTESLVVPPQPKYPLRLKHLPEWLAASVVAGLVRSLSQRQTMKLAHGLGGLVHDLWRSRRELAIANVSRVDPKLYLDNRTKLTEKIFQHTAHTFLEFAQLSQLTDTQIDQCITLPPSTESLANDGRPVIYVSAHLGNWEYLGRWLARHHGPIGLLINAQTNPLVDKMIMKWRSHPKLIFVPYRSGWTTLSQLLGRGISIALLADQRLDRGGLLLPFFGKETSWSKLPALLARRHDLPMVPLYLPRQADNSFLLEVHSPIRPQSGLPVEEDLIRLTCAYIDSCEQIITRYPEQYLFTHNRWGAGKSTTRPRVSDEISGVTAQSPSPASPSQAVSIQ